MWWAKFIVIQAAILLLLLEVTLRVYHPVAWRVRGNEIVLPVKHVYRFDNGNAKKLDRSTIHSKNSLGFRGPDPPRDFEQRLTILTIGGSTTESLFLSDGRTWTDALTRQLEPSFPNVWVNNAGIDGHTTFGHLVLLRSFVTKLRPKVAVFLIGANDIGLSRANTFDEGVIPTAGTLRSAASALAERSEVANFGLNMVRAARARDRGFGHSEIDLATVQHLELNDEQIAKRIAMYQPTLPEYAARLRQIADLTQTHGIEPVWVTQPALFGDLVDPTTNVDLAKAQVNGRGNGHVEWRLLEMYNDETRRVAAERGVLLIDLARELPKDSRYFYDFLHFTNAGSERVGEIVATYLMPHLKSRFGGERH
jgi:lysophospholipase L1-like esterase